MPVVSLNDWKEYLNQHPSAHLLQTAEWGELKAAFGWDAVRLVCGNAGAQLLFRRLPLGLTVPYMPKPAFSIQSSTADRQFWQELDSICREKRALFLKIEPDKWESEKSEPNASGSQQTY